MAADKSFAASRNADWREELQLVAGGAPVDLTGADLRMDVDDAAGARALRLRLGSGLTIVDAAQGRLAIAVPAATMFGLPAGQYAHDMLLERAGVVTRVWSGSLTVAAGVTDV